MKQWLSTVLLGSLLFTTSWWVMAATVRTASLASLVQPVQYSAPAEVVQEDHSTISARIRGTVEQILVRVGQQVSKGAVLIRLDCRDFELAADRQQATLDGLRAQLSLARQQLQRAERLLKQRNAPRELFDQRTAELARLKAEQKGAQTALAEAELAISRCEIKAPFDALVTERLTSTGSFVIPGSRLLRLLSLESPEISIKLAATDVPSLQSASQRWLEVDGLEYTVSLRSVLPLVDSRARTREARLEFTADSALAGSTGRLYWQDNQQQISPRFLVRQQGIPGLMLEMNGQVHFHPLPDAIEGQPAVVDLPLDTTIIVEGQFGVHDGDMVTVQSSEASADTANGRLEP